MTLYLEDGKTLTDYASTAYTKIGSLCYSMGQTIYANTSVTGSLLFLSHLTSGALLCTLYSATFALQMQTLKNNFELDVPWWVFMWMSRKRSDTISVSS